MGDSRSLRDDAGGALVEFLGITVLLLVPLVYVVVALSHVQAGAFAAESAARGAARAAALEGVRVLDDGGSPAMAVSSAGERAELVTQLTVEDFRVVDDAVVAVACVGGECFSPGSAIAAAVDVTVALPGVPEAVVRMVPLRVTLSAQASSPIDGLVQP